MQWAYSQAVFILPMQWACFHAVFKLHMQWACFHAVFILPMQWAGFHAVFMLPMQWAGSHAVGMLCSYSHAVCILRAHASMQCVSCLAYFVTGVSYDRKMLITHFPFCPDVINPLQVYLTTTVQ
jgi:hypothetical protein